MEGGRNRWTAEGEQRKKKLCELDDMTENLHAKHLKAQCGGVSGMQWSERVLQPERPFDVTLSYTGSALKSLDPEHIQPPDCWRSAASIKTHHGLFCSISRPQFPLNVTQRHFKKQSYQLLHLYLSLHWNTPLRHNWLLFYSSRGGWEIFCNHVKHWPKTQQLDEKRRPEAARTAQLKWTERMKWIKNTQLWKFSHFKKQKK